MSECPDCFGRGWIVGPDGGAGKASRCHCWNQSAPERLRQAMLYRGLPADLINADRETWREDWHPWPVEVDGWPESGQWALVILGEVVGQGKSHVAAAVWKRNMTPDARWITIPLQIMAMKDAMGDPALYREVVEPVYSPGMVVLDDWGWESRGNWGTEQPPLWLEFRRVRGLRTIITSNANTLEEAATGARLESRLQTCLVVNLHGKNRRGQ